MPSKMRSVRKANFGCGNAIRERGHTQPVTDSEQLSLVGTSLRVTLTYFPDARPVGGEFVAALADRPSATGVGATERGAIEQLAMRLRRTAAQYGRAAGLTGVSRAIAAAGRYDLERLADFLQEHADAPLLADPQHDWPATVDQG